MGILPMCAMTFQVMVKAWRGATPTVQIQDQDGPGTHGQDAHATPPP